MARKKLPEPDWWTVAKLIEFLKDQPQDAKVIRFARQGIGSFEPVKHVFVQPEANVTISYAKQYANLDNAIVIS